MDVEDFDPSSLLEFAMEENDDELNIPNKISFEDAEETNRNDSGTDEIINLDPDTDPTLDSNNDETEVINEVVSNGATTFMPDEVVTEVTDNTFVPNPEKENEGNTINKNDSLDLGFNNMCSVPIAMFHLLNLEQYEEEPVEPQETPDGPVITDSANNSFKKPIKLSYSEKTFRKKLFKNVPDTIRLFKLHCTVCSKHIGTSVKNLDKIFRAHRDLSVMVCKNCYEFYGSGNFPVEEGSEIYCEWCGQGGIIFCCSKCPKAFCESCIIINFGIERRNHIDATSSWSCFICNPLELWPHRAICSAIQKILREYRMKLPELNLEEREKLLDKDTSDCCLKSGTVSPIELPLYPQLKQIPLCLIAKKHHNSVVTALKNYEANEAKKNILFNQKDKINQQKTATPIIQTQKSQLPVENKTVCLPPAGKTLPNPQSQTPKVLVNCKTAHAPKLIQALQKPQTTNNNFQEAFQNNAQSQASGLSSVEIIDVDNYETPTMLQVRPCDLKNIDLSWLQKAVKESSHCLFEFQTLLNQFDMLSGKLRTDINQVNAFTNKLHSLFKITISSLATIDHNMLQDLKSCTTPKVRNYSNITIVRKSKTLDSSLSPVVLLPKVTVVAEKNSPVTLKVPPVTSKVNSIPAKPTPLPVGQEPAEEEDLSCLLFCETVMPEAKDGNKENVNNNHTQSDRRSSSKQTTTVNNSRKRQLNLRKCTVDMSIPTIILDDDEPPAKKINLTKLQYNNYYKQFNLKPCRVVLSRCDIKT